MRFYLFTFFLGLVVTGTQAQYQSKGFDLDNYHYTLNYPDHKITFYASAMDEKLKFIDPVKNYYWFSSNELKITQGGFSGKLLNGLYTDFYLNKNLKEQGEFKMGLKKGEWNTWTEKGVMIAKVYYKEGLLEGRFCQYDSVGRVSEQGTYRHGRINGKLKKYIRADSVAILNYKNGLLQPVIKKSRWFHSVFKKKAKPAKTEH